MENRAIDVTNDQDFIMAVLERLAAVPSEKLHDALGIMEQTLETVMQS